MPTKMTHEELPKSGQLAPFQLDNVPVRGKLLAISDLSGHVPTLESGNNIVTRSMAEMICCAAIMANDLKDGSEVALQVHTPGPARIMVARCGADGHLKAYADISADKTAEELTFADIVAPSEEMNPVFAVSITTPDDAHHYQSLVPVNKDSIVSSLEDYYNQSVQLRTYLKVWIGTRDEKTACGGIFLQAMPDEKNALEDDDWKRIGMLLDTIQPKEILPGDPPGNFLAKLFAEDQVRIFPTLDLTFAAPNTRGRMARALKSLGKEQCLELMENGRIDMTCEYTGRVESFCAEDIEDIFSS